MKEQHTFGTVDSEVTQDTNKIEIKNDEVMYSENTARTIQLNENNIDIKKNRYPYCIVWTPLPLISYFLPIIGHTGICT